MNQTDRWGLIAAIAHTGDPGTFSLERLLDWKDFDASAHDSAEDTRQWKQRAELTGETRDTETCVPFARR